MWYEGWYERLRPANNWVHLCPDGQKLDCLLEGRCVVHQKMLWGGIQGMLACSLWCQFWLIFQLLKQSVYPTLSQPCRLPHLEVWMINMHYSFTNHAHLFYLFHPSNQKIGIIFSEDISRVKFWMYYVFDFSLIII